MKKLVCLIFVILLLLSCFVSCDPEKEMTIEEAEKGCTDILNMILDEQFFEDGAIVSSGKNFFTIHDGNRIYYHCDKEDIAELDKLFEEAKIWLYTLEEQEGVTVTGTYIWGGGAYHLKVASEKTIMFDYLRILFRDDGKLELYIGTWEGAEDSPDIIIRWNYNEKAFILDFAERL